MAVAAGAASADHQYADIILPDGTRAWCDGGALNLWEAGDSGFKGTSVVPRVALAKGLLARIAAHPPMAITKSVSSSCSPKPLARSARG